MLLNFSLPLNFKMFFVLSILEVGAMGIKLGYNGYWWR